MLPASIDGSLTGEDMLIQLINLTNETSVSRNDIQFEDPVDSPGPGNTSIIAKPRGWGYIGQKKFDYDRISLEDYFYGVGVVANANMISVGSTYDLIPHINRKYKTQFRERDFVLAAVLGTQLMLEAAPTSYVWTGSIPVFITVDEYDISDTFFRRYLDGLDMPPIITIPLP